MKERTSPYRYLAIFTTGEQTHDNTSLVLQNISLQDTINRRERQIEFNVKRMNNGGIVSGDYYTEEQASEVKGCCSDKVTKRRMGTDRKPTPTDFMWCGVAR